MAAGGAIAMLPLSAQTLGAQTADGPYGALQPPDNLGIRLPSGFSARVVAETGQSVGNTGFVWHAAPDGGATFPTADGGWVYVSNAEIGQAMGGASMIRFNANGAIVDSRTILSGTWRNCSGGPTPWGTWLSCEEIGRNGRVWECDPLGVQTPVAQEGLGWFSHEAAAVDPATSIVYLTEDQRDSGLYRFIPSVGQNLSAGVLEVMVENAAGVISWANIPDPRGRPTETRYQVPNMKVFNRGEGAFFAGGRLVFAETGTNRVWQYTPADNSLVTIYDRATAPNPVLRHADNVTIDDVGDVFVCEDGDDLEMVVIPAEGGSFPFLQLTGQTDTELTGVAFDPSGSRMYFSSQRHPGTTYEISGPFRGSGAEPPPAQPFSCTLTGTTLSWSNEGASRYFVRAVNNGAETFVDSSTGTSITVSGNDDEYIVRYWVNGQPIDARCPGNNAPEPAPDPEPDVFSCTLAGTTLSWTNEGASRYFVRAVNNGAETFVDSSTGTSITVSGNDDEYIVRYWVNGQPIDARCPGNN